MLKRLGLERKKFITAWALGAVSLAGIFFSTRLAFDEFSINFPWSLVLPMVITLAWGAKYGFVALFAGGLFVYPFILGPYNGWASVVPVIAYVLWIGIQGVGVNGRQNSKNLIFNAYVLQILYSVARLGLYYFLFPFFLKLNGGSLYPDAVNYIPESIIMIFALKGIAVEAVFLALSDAFLQLPFIRRGLGIEVREGSHRNSLTMGLMFFGGLVFAWMLLFVQRVLVRGEPIGMAWFNFNEEAQLTLILSGIFFSVAGGVTVRFVEGTLAAKLDLERKQEALARANREILNLNEGLEKRVKERTEQLEMAVSELESFTSTVSHDLKAPLRAIQAYVSMLEAEQEKNLTPSGNDMLTEMKMTVSEMIVLIDHLLKYARMSQMPLKVEAVDLSELVAECLDALCRGAQNRKIHIETPVQMPVVQGDRVMLRQVFMNLLDNAYKFTRPVPEPRIEVSAKFTDEVLWVCVQDNGVGFEPSAKPQLFSIFGRGHRSEEFEGQGVGLATVKKIIEKHGGAVTLEGAPGQGVTACFSLPAARGL